MSRKNTGSGGSPQSKLLKKTRGKKTGKSPKQKRKKAAKSKACDASNKGAKGDSTDGPRILSSPCLVDQLTETLAKRKAPLLLTFDENYGCITAAHFDYNSRYDAGLRFRHPEGPIDIGLNVPTWRKLLNLGGEWFEQMNVANKFTRIKRECEERSLEPPMSDEVFKALKLGDRRRLLKEWLNQKLEPDGYEGDYWFDHYLGVVSEYTPGFAIHWGRNRERFPYLTRVVDLGGPASSVLAVKLEGDVSELNAALEDAELPYRMTFPEGYSNY